MTTTELALLGSAHYEARVTPLRSGGRRDVEVLSPDPDAPAAFAQTDVLGALRTFFAALDAEAEQHRGDPVATAQALARLEALLADVRTVRDSLRDMTAQALVASAIRRLTVGGIVTVEASTEVKRTDWQHEALLGALLARRDLALLDHRTGELLEGAEAAAEVLQWLRPEWRLTAVRDAGLEPDDYCTVATDDDGAPLRSPSVRIVDNVARRAEAGRS